MVCWHCDTWKDGWGGGAPRRCPVCLGDDADECRLAEDEQETEAETARLAARIGGVLPFEQ
ncbi:hypothetical protein Acid7E03_37650 [Acidisoma sp. 7E03]